MISKTNTWCTIMIPHFLYHLIRNRQLIKANLLMSQNVRKKLFLKDGVFSFECAQKRDFDECVELFNRCNVNIVPWLAKVFKKRMSELCGVVRNEQGKIIACDFFMFQEAEYGQGLIHEIYIAVDPKYRGQGISTKLRRFSAKCYDNHVLNGISTLAPFNDIKVLRSAQHCGFAILKSSAKPPAYYLFKELTPLSATSINCQVK